MKDEVAVIKFLLYYFKFWMDRFLLSIANYFFKLLNTP